MSFTIMHRTFEWCTRVRLTCSFSGRPHTPVNMANSIEEVNVGGKKPSLTHNTHTHTQHRWVYLVLIPAHNCIVITNYIVSFERETNKQTNKQTNETHRKWHGCCVVLRYILYAKFSQILEVLQDFRHLFWSRNS